jgi:pyrroline-5-carboxylate reductase
MSPPRNAAEIRAEKLAGIRAARMKLAQIDAKKLVQMGAPQANAEKAAQLVQQMTTTLLAMEKAVSSQQGDQRFQQQLNKQYQALQAEAGKALELHNMMMDLIRVVSGSGSVSYSD